MTRLDIEERRLRRMEKRIAHLAALARLMAVMGGGRVDRRTAGRVRELLNRENGRLWEMLHPDGEPEDQARKTTICAAGGAWTKTTICAGGAWTDGSWSGQSIARKGQGRNDPRCGYSVDK